VSTDLKPRHKSVAWFLCGSFFWGWLLENGAGWPLGCGAGLVGGQYIIDQQPGRSDGNPFTNDGYRVTAKEAREMARLARYIAAHERRIASVYHRLPPHHRQEIEDAPLLRNAYRIPMREEWIEKTERFAEWAEKSGGFQIK